MKRLALWLVLPASFALVVLLAAAQEGPAPASAASPNFDATFYHLRLDVRFDPDYLYGVTRVEGRAVGAPLAELALDFDTVMQVDSVLAADGQRLDFEHAADVLRIALPEAVPVGAPLAVDVFYQGVPARTGLREYAFVFGRRSNGDRFAWTLSEPYGARAWWPSKDHPSDKADSVRVTVTVPEPLRVGSNGLLVAETHEGGRATYDWVSRYPIATYLVSIAAGVYDVYEQVYERPDSLVARYGPLALPVPHYAYRGTDAFQGNGHTTGWRLVTDVLAVFEDLFGPYPFPEEKYGHAHFTFGGGMEHQTMSSMGGNGIGLIGHELAHQWYGDAVTMHTWPHLWLNEGFATYAPLLYYEARADVYPGRFASELAITRNGARHARGTLVVQDTSVIGNLFAGPRVYDKGAMVLHMLRGVVGDEAFREILRAWAAEPSVRYGTGTTADFQTVAEAIAGVDLDDFFRQWVTEGTGYPVYELAWGQREAGGEHEVTIELRQKQVLPDSNVETFVMPVTFELVTEEGPVRFTVPNDQRAQTYTFTVPAPVRGVEFDPDRWLLRSDVVPGTLDTQADDRPELWLRAPYPNPASGHLAVPFSLDKPGRVRIELYDALGRRVAVLFDGMAGYGPQEPRFELPALAAGTYLVVLEAPQGAVAQPVTLVRARPVTLVPGP